MSDAPVTKLPLTDAMKRRQAADMRRRGRRFDQIGQALGCTTSEAFNLLKEAQAETPESTIPMDRQLQLDRCDAMISALTPGATADPPDIESGRLLVLVFARQAKLKGLDAPTKTELSGPEGAPLMSSEDVIGKIARLAAGMKKPEPDGGDPPA